ncbi:hypothetical protein JCM10908_001978 [Rhodotorula pacifica]|uniref:Kei1p n=1 Tax=Rhodotorula pacifica TaxID=1495444 RepID=UPI003170E9B1
MAMRLRSQPLLDSFCGMDLKLGATLVSLFALLNKVAGAYGMLAVVLSGGAALSQPLGQITMYLYSIVSLVGFIWGLQKISEENGDKTLRYAHLFAIDHLVGTVYTTFFAVVWYVYVPHDGKRIANSEAQKAMMGGSQTGIIMDDAARTAAAMGVWQSERGFSAAVLVIGWLLKVYFVAILYSFAQHLRHGTYASLPSSSHNTVPSSKFTSATDPTRGRRYTISNNDNRTRDSPSGGPQYSHLRGNSLASTAGVGSRGSMDGLDGTETTLAETLWEDSADRRNLGEGWPAASAATSGGNSHARAESTNLAPGSPSNPRRALPRRNSRAKGAPPPLMPTLSSRNSSNAIPKISERGDEPQVPVSPAYAIGTGMTRTQSGVPPVVVGGVGGGQQQIATGAASQAEQTREQERSEGINPFAQILGRISIDEASRP